MRRDRVIPAAALAALLLAAPSRAEEREPPVAAQEIGPIAGLEGGGRVSPGGLHVGGVYLYRLTASDWLASGVGFTFGGGGAACFRSREDELLCDHGLFEGFAAEAQVGVRRFFAGQRGFVPFAGAGLSVRLSSYPDDGVLGLGVPLYARGGVRYRVAERVALVGAASLRAGVGFYDEGLGLEPHFTLGVRGGVEFALE